MEEDKTVQNSGEKYITTISEEQDNYIRMNLLLFDISPRAVRVLFDKEFHPSCLNASITKETNKLNDLKNKRIINQSQWNLLFPRNDYPVSNKFDVTLMVTLLTSLTKLIHYDKLPLQTDTTTAADLARIRLYRNELSHNKDGKMDNSNFSTEWDDIVEAVGRLGGRNMLEECKVLRTKTLDRTTVPWNIKVQIIQTLKSWKTNKFVETRAAKHILDCILDKSCVTITASSGVGKTAILQHVALKMATEGYDILLVTNPHDIVNFYNPNVKTLFVIDDFCGTYSINQTDLNNWETVLKRIEFNIQNKLMKIIVACRLQVFQDGKFETLSIFRECVCDLLSKDLCLTQKERMKIAELYLETKSSEIIKYCELYDCFPLLCKLYKDNPELDIKDFFQTPFSVYEGEIDKLLKKGHYGKYCALALCVMFDNTLKKEWFTEHTNTSIKTKIDNTCQACRLDRGTSPLVLLEELKSLEHSLIKREHGVYKSKHDKIFDFLVFYFGKTIIECIIRNAGIFVISQRFLLERKDNIDQFVTIVPPNHHQLYIRRMIEDWSEGEVSLVFENINMKISEFRERFLRYLKTLDISFQRKLAHTCDAIFKDTVLARCSQYNDIPLIQWCIYHNVDVNKCNVYGHNPLIVSSQTGQSEIVRILLHNKANVNDCAADGAFPLLVACQTNNTAIVKVLLANKADVNKCSDLEHFQVTPLHTACHNNSAEIVKLLLENEADINKCAVGGELPLDIACQYNYIELVKILLDYKPDINNSRINGGFPLSFACFHNFTEIAKLLLENGAEINQCDRGAPLLYIACQNNLIEMAKILLDNKVDINKCRDNGESPLYIACYWNHIEIVKVLLDKHADINKCMTDESSPLFVACQNNHIEIVKVLLDNKADINKCKDGGNFPLYVACQENHLEIVNVLLDNMADINKCTNVGASPLFISCYLGNTEIVKVLLDNKADFNTCDEDGASPLHVACRNKHTEIVKVLLYNNADIDKCEDHDASPLYIACQNNHIEMLKVLLDNNADINKCDENEVSPLYIACQYNHIQIVELLLDNNACINKSNCDGTFPLYVACHLNNIEIVKILLDNNADINKYADNTESPLYRACLNNHIKVVKLLLHNKADTNVCTDDGACPLHVACENNHIEIVKILLDNKADIYKCTDDGASPLYFACQNNHIEIVKILLDNKADINKCDNNEASPLYIACQNNRIDIVKILLDNNADINKCIDDGTSPLRIACHSNNIEIVKMLLVNNAELF